MIAWARAYTTLKVTEQGVVLYDFHLRRLSIAGPDITTAFESFAQSAAPGVWVVAAVDGGLHVERRAGSRLFEGIPTRFVPSPLIDANGRMPKPGPPSPYDAVRLSGVCTLLTSPDGTELYEACVAAIVGWDGARFVTVPADRPRVDSTAEAALRTELPSVEHPLRSEDTLPLLLLNALGTWRTQLPGRDPFPDRARASIEEVLLSTTARGPR